MKKIAILLAMLFYAWSTYCQETPSERKKVAVVLSGGGAKGMAHIGALKIIEQAGIPVDIVTGTSMGSIIGGLYSIGYNATVLDSLVRLIDWSFVLSDREDTSLQSLRDRQKQNTYAFSRGFTFGKQNNNDGGLIKGKNLAQLFQKLCIGYTDSLDFNQLPIPFACVATDITDNSEYDFHSGRLPQAMRASMAIPAAFSPVRIGNKVLVDGGLRNNYPADLAREMGADIIIGVTVQGNPKTGEELGHTMSILSQIIDVNCKNKYDENLLITDVPIRVNTDGYSAASFSESAIQELIRRGEAEAMKHWDDLISLKQRIGIDDTFRPNRLTPKNPSALSEKIKVTAFVFENVTSHDEHFIRSKFNLHKCDSIDSAKEDKIATSMRLDLFYQNVDIHSVPDGDGYKIIFTAGNKKTSHVYLGGRFDSEEIVALQLNADFPLQVGIPIDADLTLRLGKRIMARGEMTLHPRSFTRPSLSYTFRHNDLDVYHEGERIHSFIYNQHRCALTPINFNLRNFNLQAGLYWDYLHFLDNTLTTGSHPINLENDHYFNFHVQLNYNSENQWYFPTHGSRLKVEYAYITDNFTQLDDKAGLSEVNANWRFSIPLSKRFTLRPMVYGRCLWGAKIPVIYGNSIGGEWFGHYLEQQMPFAGIGNMEFTDRHFMALQLEAQQNIANSHFILLRLAAAQHAEEFKHTFKQQTLLGYQLGYYYNTLLGPLGATIGYSNKTKEVNFYINLGFEF